MLMRSVPVSKRQPYAWARRRSRFFWRELDDGLMVVDLNAFEFTLMNGTAALLWLELIERPRAPAALADGIASLFEADGAAVLGDVEAILDTWRGVGWLTTGDDGMVFIDPETDAPPPEPYRVIPERDLEAATGNAGLEWSRDLDFPGAPVSVRFLSEPGCEGSDVSVRAATFLAGIPTASRGSASPIMVYGTRSGMLLRLGSVCVEATDVSDALSRLVLWCFYLAYGTEDFLGTFHAAAVGKEGGAILMPGGSGVGKSTLTAYLAARGWRYGGDDIVGLSRPVGGDRRHVVLPFCSSISVKQGAVAILKDAYPGLVDLPEVFYDTKRARFPAVPHCRHMGADLGPRRISAIVFPQFDASARTSLTPLSTRETMLALAGIGYRTGERMDETLLAGMFDFLDGTPAYRLAFSEISEAEAVLEKLA
jgi:hypothetical protein